VHHASNEKYLDKNYGDVLIIWDKPNAMPEGTRQEAEKALLSKYKTEEPALQPLSRYVI
jgi:alkylglycerol monooxygenase